MFDKPSILKWLTGIQHCSSQIEVEVQYCLIEDKNFSMSHHSEFPKLRLNIISISNDVQNVSN